MNSKNLGTLAAVLAGGSALAAAVFLWPVRDAKRTAVDEVDSSAVEAAKETADNTTVTNNFVTAVKMEQMKARDFNFEKVGERFRAEGVELGAAGEITMHSEVTGGKLDQQLVRAERVKNEKTTKSLARAKKVKGVADVQSDTGNVRYDGYFAGIDLEYRYDGRMVEEFFHISDTLKAELKQSGDDLVITSLMPTMFRENGDLLKALEDTVVDQSTLVKDQRPIEPHDGKDVTKMYGSLEVNHGGHRFGLPAAYAVDATGEKKNLARTFAWTAKGLEVRTELPNAWVQAAEGQIMIDPSTVVGGTAVNLRTWNERNFVKDAAGNYHMGYMGVYSSRWVAVHTRSDDDTGVSWQAPDIIEPNYGPSENTHYTPSLVIDSNDTLHAVWSDHGHIPTQAADKGTYGSWGHRLRYAWCNAACASGVWQPNDPDAQESVRIKLVTVQANIGPTPAQHQAYSHLAVDQQDTVHITWAEWGVISARHRYFQRDAGGLSEKAGTGWNDIHSQIVVDNNNQVHYLGSDYWNNYDIRHYAWLPPPDEAWSIRPAMVPRSSNPGNGGRVHLREFTSVVDVNNHIHVAVDAYDRWETNPTYHVWYGRYDNIQQDWENVEPVFPIVRNEHNYAPSITVDDASLVHLVWYRAIQPNNLIMYARKQTGALGQPSPPWTVADRLVFSTGTQYNPQIRPRLSWPNPSPNNSVTAGVVDVLIVENGSEILYQSTGAPVQGPAPTLPLDHTFVDTNTPTFEWRRVGSDTGAAGANAITYELDVAPTPVFDGGATITINTGNNPSHTFTGAGGQSIPDGEYRYWRVKARNSYGAGPFGAIYEVGADLTAPNAFDLLTPAHQSDPGTRTPRFTWEAAIDP